MQCSILGIAEAEVGGAEAEVRHLWAPPSRAEARLLRRTGAKARVARGRRAPLCCQVHTPAALRPDV